ncbi:MAG: diacylglycerol kinase family protein [Planctomycetota bacterium]|nr:diacylglycerol kinase family protein [Planctomycetota bacterium]
MRVVLVGNPKSGRGRAARVLEETAHALRTAGHECTVLTDLCATDGPCSAWAGGGDAVVVAGGDGTIHSLLPALRNESVGIHHAPLGTENLFAREFGMRADGAFVARAAKKGVFDRVDLGLIRHAEAEIPFAIMCSIGPDAGVIRRLHAVRNGPISHASYAMPVMRETFRPALPRLTIEADGRTLCDAERGLLVVANMRQYALRADPAWRADPRDGLLDLVFMPCASALGAGVRLLEARLRRHRRDVLHVRASTVRVRTLDDAPVQVDGECLQLAPGGLDISFGVAPLALRVLMPDQGATVVAGAAASGGVAALRATV